MALEKLPYKHTGKWSKLTRGTRITVWCFLSKYWMCLCSLTWKHNHQALFLLIKRRGKSGGVLLLTSVLAKIKRNFWWSPREYIKNLKFAVFCHYLQVFRVCFFNTAMVILLVHAKLLRNAKCSIENPSNFLSVATLSEVNNFNL